MSDEEPMELPIDGVLDLHAFHPRDAKNVVNDYIDACLEKRIFQLRVIHGKGIGNLRRTVHAALERNPNVTRFELATDASGWGATLVWLEEKK